MNVKNTLKKTLMLYPSVFINALDVYVHMFCCIGNGYEWENGELVVPYESQEIPSRSKAVERALSYNLLENPVISMEASLMKHCIKGDGFEDELRRYNRHLYDGIHEHTSLIFRTFERMNDFEPHTEERYPEVRQMFPFKIYGLCEYSKLCNLPDDIKADWLVAAEWMLGFIKDNPQYWDDTPRNPFSVCLPNIEARIDVLKQKCPDYSSFELTNMKRTIATAKKTEKET